MQVYKGRRRRRPAARAYDAWLHPSGGGMAAQRAHPAARTGSSADVIDLSSEFPSGSTSPGVLRRSAIDAVEQHLCDHYRRPGIAPLCRAVASMAQRACRSTRPWSRSAAAWPKRATWPCALAATGQDVYLPAPAVYQAGLEFAGANVTTFDARRRSARTPGRAVDCTNPNPVTGQVVAPATLERLAAWADAADLAIIADERRSGAARRPSCFASLPGMAERTLTIRQLRRGAGWVPGMSVGLPVPTRLHAGARFEAVDHHLHGRGQPVCGAGR